MAGTNGTKFPDIREHLQTQIGDAYKGMNVSFDSFPDDTVLRDPKAYLKAMDDLQPGDGVIVFTPDNTHFEIGKAALERKLHLMLTKPPVQTLEQHLELATLANQMGVLADLEVHKRWDPFYIDARHEIRKHGDFTFFYSYMAQPKIQLDTFRAWVGSKITDISYYLNSHHIDWHVWAMEGIARPVRVTASASTGVARAKGYDTEDQITLTVDWENFSDPGNRGTAVYTASWVEPTSDVHTQQRFECTAHRGKVKVDQAYRGYCITRDGNQVESRNPLFMRYSPDQEGFFNGQSGYGYVSIAQFVAAVTAIINGERNPDSYDRTLPTLAKTTQLTAILEAGRKSLDNDGNPVNIVYLDNTQQNREFPVGFK